MEADEPLTAMVVRVASKTKHTTLRGTIVTRIVTEAGAEITKLALALSTGAVKHVVSFDCQMCGSKYSGDATDSETGIHGLTCRMCAWTHAEF